jgi:hypothetical protein
VLERAGAWPSAAANLYLNNVEVPKADGGLATVQLFSMAFGAACVDMAANFAVMPPHPVYAVRTMLFGRACRWQTLR